jgi:hypothetical protein
MAVQRQDTSQRCSMLRLRLQQECERELP